MIAVENLTVRAGSFALEGVSLADLGKPAEQGAKEAIEIRDGSDLTLPLDANGSLEKPKPRTHCSRLWLVL